MIRLCGFPKRYCSRRSTILVPFLQSGRWPVTSPDILAESRSWQSIETIRWKTTKCRVIKDLCMDTKELPGLWHSPCVNAGCLMGRAGPGQFRGLASDLLSMLGSSVRGRCGGRRVRDYVLITARGVKGEWSWQKVKKSSGSILERPTVWLR